MYADYSWGTYFDEVRYGLSSIFGGPVETIGSESIVMANFRAETVLVRGGDDG